MFVAQDNKNLVLELLDSDGLDAAIERYSEIAGCGKAQATKEFLTFAPVEQSQKIAMGGYALDLSIDEGGHLIVRVEHNDSSEVLEIGDDMTQSERQWAARFTTKMTEESDGEDF